MLGEYTITAIDTAAATTTVKFVHARYVYVPNNYRADVFKIMRLIGVIWCVGDCEPFKFQSQLMLYDT